jgi:two-component system sensor histidine kinase KdpD
MSSERAVSHLQAVNGPSRPERESEEPPISFLKKYLDPRRISPWKVMRGDGGTEIMKALLFVVATNCFYVAMVFIQARPPLALTFLLPILVAAIRWNASAAIVTAAGCTASLIYFYYNPFYTYEVASLSRFLGVIVFLIVSLILGYVAARTRGEARRALKQENEISDLYAFSKRLSAVHSPAGIFEAMQQHLEKLVGRKVLLFDSMGASEAQSERLGDVETPKVVLRALRKMQAAGAEGAKSIVGDDEQGNAWLVRPVSVNTVDFGVIAVDLGRRSGGFEDLHARVVALIGDAASSLERFGLARTIAEARTRAKTEQFREALIGSVSHELSVPLSAILGASSMLASAPEVTGNSRLEKLAALIHQESERLNAEIQNILDASRISSHGLQAKLEWAEPADIVNAALQRCRNRLENRKVEVAFPEELVLVHVDTELMERALALILDNAAKYSPAESVIIVRGQHEADHFVICVIDHGAGLDADDRGLLGQRFFRGKRHSQITSGLGLGFWIASAFVVANNGTIEVASEGAGKGMTVALRLPLSLGASASATGQRQSEPSIPDTEGPLRAESNSGS